MADNRNCSKDCTVLNLFQQKYEQNDKWKSIAFFSCISAHDIIIRENKIGEFYYLLLHYNLYTLWILTNNTDIWITCIPVHAIHITLWYCFVWCKDNNMY